MMLVSIIVFFYCLPYGKVQTIVLLFLRVLCFLWLIVLCIGALKINAFKALTVQSSCVRLLAEVSP